MSDRRLQVFHTVAGVLSFTKAAEILNMTQPAVTFQVRQLEEDFNTRLFDRGHNKISLTDAGEIVDNYAERIFDLYSEMQESVKRLTGDKTGNVTIGASTTIAEYMLPALLGDFKESFPDVRIRLKVANTTAIVSMVEDNAIDLGIVEGEINNKLLLVEACQIDKLVVIASQDHELAGRKSLKTSELLEYPFIFREGGSGTRSVIASFLQDAGYDESQLNIALELGSTEAIKGAVEAGMGISVVSEAAIVKELKLGTLCAIELEPSLERQFSFVRQRQKFRSSLMDDLFQFARKYCEKRHGEAVRLAAERAAQ
ncbi:MAG: LysR family transcriptional regulator [Gammaproteobacteria bacterium]|nr:LysR family transcriptional regulator [Gammaproteobacteria bacterium]